MCSVYGRSISYSDDEWVKMTKIPPTKIPHQYGSSVELECIAMGSPPPSIQWVVGDKPMPSVSCVHTPQQSNFNLIAVIAASNSTDLPFSILFLFFLAQNDIDSNAITTGDLNARATTVSRLVIDRMTASDRTFTCVAQSGGKIAHATTTVYPTENSGLMPMVDNGPKKTRIVSYYTTLLSTIGENVILPCQATGRPFPEFYWTNQNDDIIGEQNPRIKVLPNGDLMILQLKWSDMGTYTCTARNAVSKDTAETFLYPFVSTRKIHTRHFVHILNAQFIHIPIFSFFLNFLPLASIGGESISADGAARQLLPKRKRTQ